MENYDVYKWYVRAGTVQCFLFREGDASGNFPLEMLWFGSAEYDSRKPVLNEHRKLEGQKIADLLNNEDISIDEAKLRLSKIY